MRFEFATADRIIFGAGTVHEVGALALEWGECALVVTGSDTTRAEPVLEALREADVAPILFSIPEEPTTDLVREGTERARSEACDLVIGIGGGSVIDGGKAIAALLTNGGTPLDYLEVIGRGQPITEPAAPYIAIPTTAGTGAEVTRNAVLRSPEHRVKVSLRSPLILPSVAIVDPLLTHSMPPDITASTGLDALTQLVEPYVTPLATPLTDTICREGMMRAARSLPRAYERGDDALARQDMALASLFGGLALANAKLGAVHGFAGVLGGMYDAPHGAICGRLLPYVTEVNIRALRYREPDNPALDRYDEIAVIVTQNLNAEAEDAVRWMASLCAALDVPGLSGYGMRAEDIAEIVDKARRSSSMKGNPIVLTEQELAEILTRAW
ncbi:MAG: iron-containing alcohol dehydrogenase [Anaerolineae bacterium]